MMKKITLFLFVTFTYYDGILGSPNILFIIADDMTWIHAGIYGCDELKTPNLDKLGEEGVVFENAFVSTPSCTPSRSSILTGRNSFELEDGFLLGGYLPQKFTTYTELLERAGYKIGATGKGWGPGILIGRDVNPAGKPYRAIRNNPYQDLICDVEISDVDYAGNFNNFLYDCERDQPFCFWLGTHEPHKGYTRGFAATQGISSDDVTVPGFFPDAPEVRGAISEYLAEIQHIDTQVGKVMDVLKKHGKLENTLIIFTSDNGMPFPRVKSNLYEYGLRMPLIAWWGDNIVQGRRIEDLISLTDVAPTFLEAAGLTVPREMSGTSFLPLLQSDRSGKIREGEGKVFACIERHGHQSSYPARSIRTDMYHLIWNAATENPTIAVDGGPIKDLLQKGKDEHSYYYDLVFGIRPEFELYKVQEDPYELNNLAADPNYKDELNKLKNDLFEYLKKRKDPRMSGGEMIWEYSPIWGLYNQNLNYSPETQGQDMPASRIKEIMIENYRKRGYVQEYIDKVLERLNNNLE